jgi:hypothetical protein
MAECPVTQYENGLETNIYGIAEQVCASPPGLPGSIQLMLDHDAEPQIEFEMLSEFTVACMKCLFGSNVTPLDLTQADFEKLFAYVKSVGYILKYDRQETDTEHKFIISFERYKPVGPSLDHLKKYMS